MLPQRVILSKHYRHNTRNNQTAAKLSELVITGCDSSPSNDSSDDKQAGNTRTKFKLYCSKHIRLTASNMGLPRSENSFNSMVPILSVSFAARGTPVGFL